MQLARTFSGSSVVRTIDRSRDAARNLSIPWDYRSGTDAVEI